MAEIAVAPIARITYTDPDELESAFSRQQAFQVVQLDTQPLQCHILTLNLDDAIFAFRTIHNPLRILGDKKADRLVFEFLLSSGTGSLISHGTPIEPNTLYGFDNTRGINMVLPANTVMATLIIRRDLVQDCLSIMDRTDLNDRFFATNAVQSPDRFSSAQHYLRELYGLVQQRSPFLNQPPIATFLLEDYLPLLISSIPPKQHSSQSENTIRNRTQLVGQAEEYMLANLDQPITLKELCTALYTSKSPLSYGFQEIFGISPMAYLKLLRLRAVHKTLKTADPTTRVTDIAQRFGFWHAGRFSQEYKQLFGELPSETLQR